MAPQSWRLAIDYGTTKIAAAWSFVRTDGDKAQERPTGVHFRNGINQAPNIAAYVNEEFFWGLEVLDKFENESITSNDIIRFAKLAILPDPKTEEFRVRVSEQLRRVGKTVEDLVADSLRKIIQHTIEYARSTPDGRAYKIEQLPMDLFVSVPQMWTLAANRTMTMAAQRAGARNCKLVYEPESAAVYSVEKQMLSLEPEIREQFLGVGSVLLVADCGGGTADFVSYRLVSSLEDKSQIQFVTVQCPEGQLCGSQWINEEFLQWFQNHGISQDGLDFADILGELGHSQGNLKTLALEQFEDLKLRFNNLSTSYSIMLRPAHNHSGRYQIMSWDLRTMQRFFDTVINKIILAINKFVHECNDIKCLLLPGGLGRSPYFYNKLRQAYEPDILVLQPPGDLNWPSNPVPYGALMRDWVSISSSNRGVSKVSWGTLITEDFDENKHPDGILNNKRKRGRQSGGRKKKAKVAYDNCVVKEDIGHPENGLVVLDRWNPLQVKGAQYRVGRGRKSKTRSISKAYDAKTTETEQQQSESQYKLYHIPVPTNGEVVEHEIDIYYCDTARTASTPCRKRIADDYEAETVGPADYLEDDVHYWGTCQIRIPDPKALGWVTQTITQGRGINKKELLIYEVWICYALRFDGPNVEFLYDLRQNDLQPFDVWGQPRTVDATKFEWEPRWKHEIMSAKFLPIPQGSLS